jgi:hypothetical protein
MPSLSIGATRTLVKGSGESILFGFDFGPVLASGETLSSVSIAGSPSGLTIGTVTVQSSSFTDEYDGSTIAANEGCKARISGGTAGSDYALTATATTSAGNTRVMVCTLQVRDS